MDDTIELHPIEVALGVETSVGDPFVVTRTARAAVAVRPDRWVGAEVAFGLAPAFGSSLTRDARALIEDNALLPSISMVGSTTSAQLRFTPIQGEGAVSGAVHFGLGLGVVQTTDLLATDSPRALAAERQLHPAWTAGVSADAWRGPWGLRVSGTRFAYREDYAGDVSGRELWLLGASGVARF